MKAEFYEVKDIMKKLNRSRSFCYGVIRKLNNELEKKGILTNSGRVNAEYFLERYGFKK